MDQFNQAPAPTKEEFDDLSSTVSSLSDSITGISLPSKIIHEGVGNGSQIPCRGYGAMFIGGLLDQVGNVAFTASLYGGSIVIKNLFDGTTWQNASQFSLSWSNNILTFHCTAGSMFTTIELTSGIH